MVEKGGKNICDLFKTKRLTVQNYNVLRLQGDTYPRLQILARRLLAIPATSSSSERVFSKAGFIMGPRRKRLAPKTVEAIVFLHQHLKNQRRFEAEGESGTGGGEGVG